MAADVSCLVREMNGGDNEPTTAPITRDLLGGCCTLDAKELDLDLQVPCGWEKRLDLTSGKVYLQRCNSSSNSSSSETTKSPHSKFQDLNSSPPSTLNLFDSTNLVSSNYESVCTLDKVKSALERAEKENTRKRALSLSSSSPPISTSSSSVVEDLVDEKSSTASIAAGCPSCLMYVLISRCNPKCPRCCNEVPLPVVAATAPAKKPRIDLNISI